MNRRDLITGLSLGASGLLLGGCDRLNANPSVRRILGGAEGLNLGSQQRLAGGAALSPPGSQFRRTTIWLTRGCGTWPSPGCWELACFSS